MSNEQCECGILEFPIGKEHNPSGSFVRVYTSSTYFDVDLRHSLVANISTEQQFNTISKSLPNTSIIPTSYTIFLGSEQTISGSLRIILLTKDGLVLAQKYINDFDDNINISDIFIEECHFVEKKDLSSEEILIQIYSICNRKTETCCEQPPQSISLSNQINSLCISEDSSTNLFTNPTFTIDPPPPSNVFELNFGRQMPGWNITPDVDLGYITLYTVGTNHTWLPNPPEGTPSYIDNNDLSWDLEGYTNDTRIGSISQSLTLESNKTHILYFDLAANLLSIGNEKICHVEIKDTSNNLVMEHILDYKHYFFATRQRLPFTTNSSSNFLISFKTGNTHTGYGAVITRPQLVAFNNEIESEKRVYIISYGIDGSTFSVNAAAFNNNTLFYKWQKHISTYVWSTISGATSNSYNATSSGEYRVLIYDNYGHATVSSSFFI